MIWPSLVQLSKRSKSAEVRRLDKLRHEAMRMFVSRCFPPLILPSPESMHGAADEFGGSDYEPAFTPGEMSQNVGGPYR